MRRVAAYLYEGVAFTHTPRHYTLVLYTKILNPVTESSLEKSLWSVQAIKTDYREPIRFGS